MLKVDEKICWVFAEGTKIEVTDTITSKIRRINMLAFVFLCMLAWAGESWLLILF
jgi:hypothetical protein